jgi:hypothetical protein
MAEAEVKVDDNVKERCFVRACKWNKEAGCEKPDDEPCPALWWLTGDINAGRGEKMARKWEE